MRGQVADHLHSLVDGQRQPVDLRQAAVDSLLALCDLQLGAVHFPGSLFGRLGHVLHGVGHFVHGGSHLVHLQRLLGTALLGGPGIVTHMPGRLGQRMGGPLQLADHALQLAIEAVEVFTKAGDFVATMGVQAPGQVTFATGDIAHGLHRFLKGAGNAAGDQHHHQRHQQGNAQANQRGIAQLAGEFGLHVIDVHARPDDPAPWFEQLYVGGLGHRLARPGLGPAVVDRARVVLARQGDHLIEHGKAVGVADG